MMIRDYVKRAMRNQCVNSRHDPIPSAHLTQNKSSLKATAFVPNRTFTVAGIVLLAACFAFGPANVARAGQLFGSDILVDGLITINTNNGAGSFVGVYSAVPQFGAVGGLAYDSNTGTLLGVDATTFNLITINTATGLATSVGSLAFGGNISSSGGLAFDPNSNTLYWANPTIGVAGIPQLFTVNTGTGASTLVGTFTSNTPIVGLAYDPNTDTLYGVDGLNPATNDKLYTINPLTAALTGVGTDLGFDGDDSGLAFDPDTNTLFWGDETTDSLYTVDTTTGSANLVGPFGTFDPDPADNFVRGLAFQSTVPEPSSFLLLGMGAVGVLGYGRRRKRKMAT